MIKSIKSVNDKNKVGSDDGLVRLKDVVLEEEEDDEDDDDDDDDDDGR